jgi:hypothetical protein
MWVVRNNILPFSGFSAMAVFPFVFVRKDEKAKDTVINHEKIHLKQQGEMLLLLFYVWYVVEYVFRVFQYLELQDAYHNISFEREAYENEGNHDYLDSRRRYAFLKYVFYHKIIK